MWVAPQAVGRVGDPHTFEHGRHATLELTFVSPAAIGVGEHGVCHLASDSESWVEALQRILGIRATRRPRI